MGNGLVDDTIAAVATPRGEGAVGIVRISGPAALPVALQQFRRPDGAALADPTPRRAYFGTCVDADGEPVDQVLLTWYRAPQSYTGEDVVELSAHGSELALSRILAAACRAGARVAEPGEYTRRAFLNGRLDLARAEAVMDVIRARTDAGLRLAARQLQGRLSSRIRDIRELLVGLLAEIEASIDFPDDVQPPPPPALAASIRRAREQVHVLLQTAEAGRLYREGAALVIAGRPNVGKSSILNALLGEERAIVTSLPGTTRDPIEETVHLAGIPLKAVDTAGLREPEDPIELIGVERTRTHISTADLVLLVVDASAGVLDEDRQVLRNITAPVVVAANKIDLGSRLGDSDLTKLSPVLVSALTGEGMEPLRARLRQALIGGAVSEESILVSSVRHCSSLESARSALTDASSSVGQGRELALVAMDLAIAADQLGAITGDTVVEETITQIFARFCVGK